MGFFEKLFGKKTAVQEPREAISEPASSPDGDIAPQLAAALTFYQAGRFDRTVAAAQPYTTAPDDPLLRADANRLCALAWSGLNSHRDAFPYWLALFQDEPSAHNALQLATTSVMCGEYERGEAWLQKFDQVNDETHEMSSALARTNFISALGQADQPALALPHLEWMRSVYAQVHVTDSHFLYMRGVAFFSVFLEKSLPLLQSTLSASQIHEWYSHLDGKLDDDGQAMLTQWINSLPTAAAAD